MVRRDSDRKKRLFKFLDSVIGGPTTPKMFFPSRCIETQVDRSIRSWGGNVSIRFLSGKLLRKGTCFIDSFRVPDQISQVARTPASRLILTTSFYSFPLPRCPFPTPNGHFPTALAPSFPSTSFIKNSLFRVYLSSRHGLPRVPTGTSAFYRRGNIL